MNKYSMISKSPAWLMAVVIIGVMAGCGGGGGGGGGGAAAVAAPIIPGAACSATGILIPRVTSSSPTNGSLNVSISTAGVANNGKQITATFSLAMDPNTINSAVPGVTTFTLKNNTTGGTNVPGDVVLSGTGTTATFTTTAVGSAALVTGNSYTATITTFAKSNAVTKDPLGCAVAWTFTAGAAGLAGQANVDLGRAAPFALFAGPSVTLVLPGGPGVLGSLIEGSVGINPGVACTNCAIPTTITGELHTADQTAIDAQTDFFAAFTDASTRGTSACTLANPTDMTAPQGACVGYTAPPGTGGVYLPGLYTSAVSIGIGVDGTITLDGGGDPDAVFIFQTGDAITTGVRSTIILMGQAKAKNVWWTAASAATLSLNSTFKGNVIADAGASVGVGSDNSRGTLVEGRVFSKTAAATVGGFTTITLPQ